MATIRNTPTAAQIQNALRDARTTFLTCRKTPRPRVSAGRGVPRRPSRRSEGLYASPLGREFFSQLRAVVLEYLQIADRVRK